MKRKQNKMNIAIIGATGFTGSAILKEALERGHRVKAIARKADRLGQETDNLQKIAIDVMDTHALEAALKGSEVVVSAYGAGVNNPDFYNTYTKAVNAIESSVERAGGKRLIVIGGAGTLEVAPGMQLLDSPLFPEEYREIGNAIRSYFVSLRKNRTLDWTFFSPAIEILPAAAGDRTGKFRLGNDQVIFDSQQRSTLSVQDVAVAIVDEAEQGRFVKQRFTAAY